MKGKIRYLMKPSMYIQADSKGFAFLAVRGKGGHPESKKDRKLGSKTYQF